MPVEASLGAVVQTSADYLRLVQGGRSKLVPWTAITDAIKAAADCIYVDDYGAVGDGITDDLAAINAAVTASYITGKTVFFRPKVYAISGSITSTQSVRFVGPGATLYRTSDAPHINLVAPTTTAQAIVSITPEVNYDYSQIGVTTKCSMIELNPGHGVQVGDLIKIGSDDNLAGTDPALNARCGENQWVGAVIGNDVYTLTRLRDTYTTNPRLNIYNQAINFDIRDLEFTSVNITTFSSSCIDVTTARTPKLIDLSCPASGSAFIQFNSCVGHETERCVALNLRNDTLNGGFGYGLLENSCEGGRTRGCFYFNCRHGTTTGTSQSTTNDDLRKYGRTRNSVISACTSMGCTGSNFDTHQDAEMITFIGCKSFGSPRGYNGTGAGFTIRGHKISLIGCSDDGSQTSVSPVTNYAGMTGDIEITNFTSRNSNVPFEISGRIGQPINGIRIINPTVETTSVFALTGTYFDAELINPRFTFTGATPNINVVRLGVSTTLRVEGGAFDYTQNTQTGHIAFAVTDPTASLYAYNPRVIATAGQARCWGSTSDLNGNFITPTMLRVLGGQSNVGMVNGAVLTAGVLTNIDMDVGVDDGRGGVTGIIILDPVAAGNLNIALGIIGSPQINCRIQADFPGIVVNSIDPPVFDGQELTIHNRYNSAAPFLINHNISGLIATERPVWLRPGQSVTLKAIFGLWTSRGAHGVELHPGYRVGRWYGPGFTATNDIAVVANNLYALPIVIHEGTKLTPALFQALGVYVATGASGNVKMALYDTQNGVPTNLIVETSADVSTAAAGDAQCALPANISLAPGVYWPASCFSGTPTIRSIGADTAMGQILGSSSVIGTMSPTSNTRGVNGGALTYVTGSPFFPATFPAFTYINSVAAAPIGTIQAA